MLFTRRAHSDMTCVFLCVSCVYLAGTTLLTTNSLSIICVLICATGTYESQSVLYYAVGT